MKERFYAFQALTPRESQILKRYSDTLVHRADKGDEEAKLAVLITSAQGSDDETAVEEAATWLEEVSSRGKNINAMYYYALYLETGDFAEVADHPGGNVPAPSYYIDVDRLDDFLGVSQGVNPEGGPDSDKFDFKAWLKTERKRRLSEIRQQVNPPSSSVEQSSSEESNTQKSGGSCASKREARGLKAFELLRKCIDAKHQKSLATLYLLSMTRKDNEEETKKILDKIRSSTDGLALLRAAEVTQDLLLYEKAAETGFAPAIYKLAIIHHDTEDSEVSYLKFLELLQLSSAKGHSESQYISGKIEQTSGNEAAAFDWYKRAASLPDPDPHACFELGVAYFEGSLGQTQSMPLAAQYFRLGGKLGHADCLCNLATLYYNGWGVEQSFEKSFYCNQNAAVLGSEHAMTNLADMYENGIGVPKSKEQAEYYTALAKGNPDTASAVLSMLQESIARQQQSQKKSD